MSHDLSRRAYLRRTRPALRRMSHLQREILLAIRFEDASYPDLAERHAISVEAVMEQFTIALLILSRCVGDRQPWWRRFGPW
jgi:DNA-directed RNA polymerase specialized sigma24 family protein